MAKPRVKYSSSPRTSIPAVANAGRVYGVRHFRYPIDVVNHENALEDTGQFEEVHHRLTCRLCKRFQPPKHIIDHHEQRSMDLFADQEAQTEAENDNQA